MKTTIKSILSMIKTTALNLGSVMLIGTFGIELVSVIYDLRYIAMFLLVLISLDFWLGMNESKLHYREARQRADAAAMSIYEFHLSRATRRTAVKAVDYTGVLALFVLGGLILEQCGVGVTHMQAAAVSLIWAAFAEGWSICTHILVLRGHDLDRSNLKSTIGSFAAAVAIHWLKAKDADLGGAIERTIDDLEVQNGDKKGGNHAIEQKHRESNETNNQ